MGETEEKQIADEGVLDYLYGVLFAPVQTLKRITKKKPLVLALAVYLIVSWLTSISPFLAMGEITPFPLRSANLISGLAVMSLIAIPFALISIFVLCGFYHLLAKWLFKLEGEYRGIVSAVGFADFPFIFFAPFSLFNNLVGGITGALIYGLVAFALSVWVIILHIIAIRENYSTSTGKAVAVYFIPLVILGLLLIALVVIAIVLFVQVASGLY